MKRYWVNNYWVLIWVTAFSLLGLTEGSVGSFSHGSDYEVYFTPQDDCTAKIVGLIRRAKQSIYVQAYFLTSQPIIQALVKAKASKVDIKVLVDKNHPENQKGLGALSEAKIPIWVDQRSGISHNKVMVIDQKIVITGSFNFTHAANHKNRENLLIIRDKPLAKHYRNNWYECQLRAANKPVHRAKVESLSLLEALERWIEPWMDLVFYPLEKWLVGLARYFNHLLLDMLQSVE